MAISFDSGVFKLDAGASSYVMKIGEDGSLLHLYYGARLDDMNLDYILYLLPTSSFSALRPELERTGYSPDTMLTEYSCNGTGDYRASALQICDADGYSATDMRYVSHRILPGKYALPGLPATYAECESDADTLEITLEDPRTHIRTVLFYGVYTHLNAIARAARIENPTDKTVVIERAYSACVDLPRCDFDLVNLWGHWSCERNVSRRPIEHGSQGISSKRGSSGHAENPFVALCSRNADETCGDIYAASFVYSGNFDATVEVDSYGATRLLMGLEATDFAWRLEPGETFTLPEAVLVYSAEGFGEMSRTFHRLYRKHLVRGEWKTKRRPILVNNWEATYFNFDEEKLVAIARDAADLGIEMLVMDDGWFGERNDDRSSLGDWFVNEKKLCGGLKALVDRVNALGVKFGIWFEPEMISPISRLYEEHPDWVLSVPGRAKSIARHQYVLDMSRPDVCDYLFDAIAAILESANIEYVKWDFNRNLTEAGSLLLPADRQKEIFHRYVLGLYELLDRLHTAFPHLLLEGCSGGGGRFDPGMLYYTPQIWTSDDTDACERLFIQHGTSLVYPPSSISAHVSASPNHQTGRETSFATRGAVAMGGAFGYELDLTKLTDEERVLVREQVQNYHKYYDIIQNGDYYRLISPFEDKNIAAWSSVSEDRSTAIVTIVSYRYRYARALFLKLSGLAPDRTYVEEATGRHYLGSTLMNAGLNLTRGFRDGESMIIVLRSTE
ncbi:MAG: alpha-galactosidase [Clostridiaceae bacterium]|nr:alpha-galactosidase [Clostridiaceae bacterium]